MEAGGISAVRHGEEQVSANPAKETTIWGRQMESAKRRGMSWSPEEGEKLSLDGGTDNFKKELRERNRKGGLEIGRRDQTGMWGKARHLFQD